MESSCVLSVHSARLTRFWNPWQVLAPVAPLQPPAPPKTNFAAAWLAAVVQFVMSCSSTYGGLVVESVPRPARSIGHAAGDAAGQDVDALAVEEAAGVHPVVLDAALGERQAGAKRVAGIDRGVPAAQVVRNRSESP